MPSAVITKRLLLRKPVKEDAQSMFERFASDPAVTRYLTWKTNSSLEQTTAFVSQAITNWATGDEYAYVICTLNDPIPFGTITLKPKANSASIGYVIAKPEWGKGYVTEALSALVAITWEHTSCNLLTVYCDVDNIGSAKVLNKVGFTFKEVRHGYSIHPNISTEPRDVMWFELKRPS